MIEKIKICGGLERMRQGAKGASLFLSGGREGRVRAESDKADAKGGTFLSPFVPAGETPDAAQRAKTGRAFFICWRGHPKLFIAKQKRSGAKPCFFAEQTALSKQQGRQQGCDRNKMPWGQH